MFDVSFSEIGVIVLVFFLVVDPKKLPNLAKDIKQYYLKFKKLREDLVDIAKKIDLEGVYEGFYRKDGTTKMIIGDDGHVYEAYDLTDIVKKHQEIEDDGKNTDN